MRYNRTVHASTGRTPFALARGRTSPVTELEWIKFPVKPAQENIPLVEITDRIDRANGRNRRYRGGVLREFQEGDFVWLRGSPKGFDKGLTGPYEVVRRTSATTNFSSIFRWAISDASLAVEKGRKKCPLVFPVDKLHSLLQKEIMQSKVDFNVCVYIAAVLEYIAADILKLVGNYVTIINQKEISLKDVELALCADKGLMELFYTGGESSAFTFPEICSLELATSPEEVAKDLIAHERHYLRELHLIIKVFRAQISSIDKEDLDSIFSNITEVEDVTRTLLSSLEDCVEATEGNQPLAVGTCFEELAEGEEFDVYDRFAADVLSQNSRDKLKQILNRADVAAQLGTSGQKFLEGFRFVVPKLMLTPIYHFLQYFDYIKAFLRLNPSEEDRESLEVVEGLLQPLKVKIERGLSQLNLPPQRVWYSAVIPNKEDCMLYLHPKEGQLRKVGKRAPEKERYAFLFDRVLVLCKVNTRRMSVTGVSQIREKFFLRLVDMNDLEDTPDLKNAFEITPRSQDALEPSGRPIGDSKSVEVPVRTILLCKSPEEKSEWMAHLIMLIHGSYFNRILESIMAEEASAHPLQLPPVEKYRFAQPDTPDNIVPEDTPKSGPTQIKAATLLKLVERFTYHLYADPNLIRTFLTTYRSFCTPSELLSLLKERFDIPELEPDPALGEAGQREVIKRFRTEYVQPVQFRVLNVIRHWVDGHFYDFERDAQLLDDLVAWLDFISIKPLRKWLDSIQKTIRRRRECPEDAKEFVFGADNLPPPVEWHIPNLAPEDYGILTRIIEVMMVMYELNNFNGVLEVVSAIDSAAIHRLNFSLSMLPAMHKKSLQEARDLSKDHFKKYKEKLRNVNPPCIPFMGMYMTAIVHIDEGNQDYLREEDGVINFGKSRKVAEITGEIQQNQNQPYCLKIEESIREFLENLCPFPDLTVQEIDNYLYQKSREIEPKDVDKPPKFARKYSHLSLKSPGIKPKSMGGGRGAIPTPLSLTEGLRRPKSASGGAGTFQQPNTAPPPLPPRPPRGHGESHGEGMRPPARPPRSGDDADTPPPLPPRDRPRSSGIPNGVPVAFDWDHPPPPTNLTPTDSPLSLVAPFATIGPILPPKTYKQHMGGGPLSPGPGTPSQLKE
ncbi:unnamed protein product [Cyprideis torosa]|uniref:Uncharacterized protein n=1 Tax=Cyprideis torosa TaxID=163714 RepID=A0A7R8WA46_9CRUS|nr:unnamed protein product [Cyprideis torosa]CAG0884965.1 unnamed protein product [Cyprideis torosa]